MQRRATPRSLPSQRFNCTELIRTDKGHERRNCGVTHNETYALSFGDIPVSCASNIPAKEKAP